MSVSEPAPTISGPGFPDSRASYQNTCTLPMSSQVMNGIELSRLAGSSSTRSLADQAPTPPSRRTATMSRWSRAGVVPLGEV